MLSVEMTKEMTKHRFTAEEWRRMREVGIFGESDRVELIRGEIMEMAPIEDSHVGCVVRLITALSRSARNRPLLVSVQHPLKLGETDEPQPDLALLEHRRSRRGVPTTGEVALIVEVASTLLAYDRDVKFPLYAQSGVPEAWLVDLNSSTIEVHANPDEATGGYRSVRKYCRGEELRSEVVPNLALDVGGIVGE